MNVEYNGETFKALVTQLENVVEMYIPKASGKYRVTGDEDRNRLSFRIEFDDNSFVALLMGYYKTNLRSIMQMLRGQQIHPHDRYIELRLVRSDGSEQLFLNKDCAKFRKQSRNEGMSSEDIFTRSSRKAFIQIRENV